MAQRYDVGLANLRRKALAEGWTRRAHAQASDRAPAAVRAAAAPPQAPYGLPERHTPDDLGRMINEAMRHASRQLAEGRGSEAQATLKALAMFRALYRELMEVVEMMDAAQKAEGWSEAASE